MDKYPVSKTIGIDEAGRGCLWGPVVAAAVLLPESVIKTPEFEQLKDSKTISAKKRERIADWIKENAVSWGVGSCSAKEIDSLKIVQANNTAMHRAIDICIAGLPEELIVNDLSLLFDGNYFQTYEPYSLLQDFMVKGDSIHKTISAASIIAKTTRDNMVLKSCEKDPSLVQIWNMNRHKGYGTKAHFQAIQSNGIHEHHRKTFRPCSSHV